MTGKRTRGIVQAAICVALAAAGLAAGHVVGATGAPDLDRARAQGDREGVAIGRANADRRGFRRGRREGERAGYRDTYRRAYRAAHRRTRRRTEESAVVSQAPSAPEPSGRDRPPGSRYTEELPNGRPGYVLPEDQRSMACVGIDAQTGECVGD
jgi:hypothetical protein